MAGTSPDPWEPQVARRFVGGFGLLSVSALLQSIAALFSVPRAVLLAMVVPMSVGAWISYDAYKAAGQPEGRIFSVGHPAAIAAGMPTQVWDVLVVAVPAAAVLQLVARL